MKKLIYNLVLFAAVMLSYNGYAQNNKEVDEYRRSSIYTILINHEEQKYATEIRNAFVSLPVPDKYNDHNLSVKVLTMSGKLKDAKSDEENEEITEFLNNNKVASRLVGKWFNRDIFTGECNSDLVKERGLYDANTYDVIMAEKSARSMALLQDSGEDLIGNTFVLVNDIRYVDKEKTGKAIGGALRILGALASIASGVDVTDLTDNLGSMMETLKGFKVKVNTFLYQLVWDEEIMMDFYTTMYSNGPDNEKVKVFENRRGDFKLKYVGKVESKGGDVSFMGVNLDEPINMVRKACQRALDENIADLQQEFEAFRTNSPLISVEPLKAHVGLKENVTAGSRFEVLQAIEDETGKRTYKRVGVITPEKDQIWDNRYMALEEGAANASIGATTFKKVSGGPFYQGMLIREIKN
ncbi:MAG: hypothetical protein IKT74_05350 [Bacteroidales bacterium]|nr:hypothetical protein [Bacteroidales bacterium]